MTNTVTQRTIMGAGSEKNVVRLINVVSDGSEETALVLYDNSAFVADVTKGRLVRVIAVGDACIARLEWDQTANSPIMSINPLNGVDLCLKELGGIPNPGAAGATGDLVLTTADLEADDEFTLILHIQQN